MLLTGENLIIRCKNPLPNSGFTSVDPYCIENTKSCPQDINLFLLQFQASCDSVI